MQDLEGRTQVLGLEAAGVQAPALQEVPGQELFLLLSQDFSRTLVGTVDVTSHLPVGEAPSLVGGILAYFIELGSLQEELQGFGGPLILDRFVGIGHGCLRVRLRSARLYGP